MSLNIFNQENFSKLCFGVNDILLCVSFPQFFERESRVFSKGTGFRLKDLPTGRQAAGMTDLSHFRVNKNNTCAQKVCTHFEK